MFSQTLEYALRAMAQLASEGPGSATTQSLAKSTGVPAAYLSKVLQTLRVGGLVKCRRGVGGGVRLARAAKQISLLDVINAVDPLDRNGNGKRAPAVLLQLNRKLDAARAQLEKSCAATSLADVAAKRAGAGR
jgi:Rrf2 family nitric oxide-sensitive transcriptional repressor